ncbi:gluconate 2-dehydrogenase subunit 3 family protein [Catalinimonas niigatensis]|uniref:gluconate 2-dehydrogenase subunit 3 family protein n=1 Tax=Catalinimonas niigatensis TaxID=1397264 RepID=UPI002665AEF7|nr:gluconate 2-dehydrogenase subunit 3 family protein [Catalinimonas niigatensis]WPP48436.1 gluconate 2-dehydrogenase subunit 3 family protein [Catalinimonas niigatensis]
MMDRRTALKRTALMMGGALSSSAIAGVLNGCSAKKELNWKPVFLTEDQAAATAELAERIIPKTDTPGAKDVGIPEFIDMMLNDVYTEEEQQQFVDGIVKLNQDSQSQYSEDFANLEPEQMDAIIQMQADAVKDYQGSGKAFFLLAKELVMLGFFTSEVGATQVLQYAQVPGRYEGCISIEEAGGRTWATG